MWNTFIPAKAENRKAGWFVKHVSPADLRNAFRTEADGWAKAAKLVNDRQE